MEALLEKMAKVVLKMIRFWKRRIYPHVSDMTMFIFNVLKLQMHLTSTGPTGGARGLQPHPTFCRPAMFKVQMFPVILTYQPPSNSFQLSLFTWLRLACLVMIKNICLLQSCHLYISACLSI